MQDQTTQDFKLGIWDEKATNVAVVFNIARISLQYKAECLLLIQKKTTLFFVLLLVRWKQSSHSETEIHSICSLEYQMRQPFLKFMHMHRLTAKV